LKESEEEEVEEEEEEDLKDEEDADEVRTTKRKITRHTVAVMTLEHSRPE
jgi:hypothetical protein